MGAAEDNAWPSAILCQFEWITLSYRFSLSWDKFSQLSNEQVVLEGRGQQTPLVKGEMVNTFGFGSHGLSCNHLSLIVV